MSFLTIADTPFVWGLGCGNRSESVECVCGGSKAGTADGYFGIMRRLKVRSRVGLAFMALLLSACGDGCDEDPYPRLDFEVTAMRANSCVQKLNVELEDRGEVDLDLALTLYINGNFDKVDHSSEFVETSKTSGYFDLTVGDTVPSDAVNGGLNRLYAIVYSVKTPSKTIGKPEEGYVYVSDCVEEHVMSSSAAPEPDSAAPEPDSDVEQPVSDLKAEFHFAKSADTFGCPFMQVVDVAGVADNADVSLKFSIDGTPVEHTAEFITEDEYVVEGFDGYFDLVAGDDFKTELEGEHTLQVEVSDGVGSVTIEGKFTADSCPPN